MTHSIELDPDRQLAFVRFRGEVLPDDPVDVIRELVARPGWTPRCDRIVQYDDALLGGMASADFKRAASRLQILIARHYGQAPSFSAHVCDDALQRTMLEYWMTIGPDIYSPSLALFHTVNEAEAWISEQRAALAYQAQPTCSAAMPPEKLV